MPTPALPTLDYAGLPAVGVALGRHALALVAQDVRARGVHQVAIADYYCTTMVLPFELEGFHVTHLPLNRQLMALPEAIDSLALDSDPASWAVLHTDVFGCAPEPALAAALERIRRAGATLIVDATHSWPLPPQVRGDYLVASIRKFAHVSDAALVHGGRIGSAGGPQPAARGAVDLAEEEAWRHGDEDRAEELMDCELAPVWMSASAAAEVRGLNLPVLVKERQDAARKLYRYLSHRGITPLSPPRGHFCVAFRHPAGSEPGRALVRQLAQRGIDGPVWWPRPRAAAMEWPDDVVTLPVSGVAPEDVIAILETVNPRRLGG